MVGRDEWFAINVSGPIGQGLGAVKGVASGFIVDPEAAPALRAGFEEALQEMHEAKRAARAMDQLGSDSVNPVVDKYMVAMIDRATGEEGSVTAAADSAIAAYQDVLDQLDRVMGGYRGDDDTVASSLRRQP